MSRPTSCWPCPRSRTNLSPKELPVFCVGAGFRTQDLAPSVLTVLSKGLTFHCAEEWSDTSGCAFNSSHRQLWPSRDWTPRHPAQALWNGEWFPGRSGLGDLVWEGVYTCPPKVLIFSGTGDPGLANECKWKWDRLELGRLYSHNKIQRHCKRLK